MKFFLSFKFEPNIFMLISISTIAFCFVFSQEVDRLCSELGMRLYRTSVKEDMGVSSVFQHLAEDYVSKIKSFNDELIHVSTI